MVGWMRVPGHRDRGFQGIGLDVRFFCVICWPAWLTLSCVYSRIESSKSLWPLIASPKNIAGAERLARDIAHTEKEIAYYLDRLDITDERVSQGFDDQPLQSSCFGHFHFDMQASCGDHVHERCGATIRMRKSYPD